MPEGPQVPSQPEEPELPPARDRLLAIFCVLAIIICIFMTCVELSRAMAGDSDRAWAYTLEWPAFAAVIIWIWRKLGKRYAEERLAQQRAEMDSPPGPDLG